MNEKKEISKMDGIIKARQNAEEARTKQECCLSSYRAGNYTKLLEV